MLNKNKTFSGVTALLVFLLFSATPLMVQASSQAPTEEQRLFDIWRLVQIIVEDIKTSKGPGQLADTLARELDQIEKEKEATLDAITLFRKSVQESHKDLAQKLIKKLYYGCIKTRPEEKNDCLRLTTVVARVPYKEKGQELDVIVTKIIEQKESEAQCKK